MVSSASLTSYEINNKPVITPNSTATNGSLSNGQAKQNSNSNVALNTQRHQRAGSFVKRNSFNAPSTTYSKQDSIANLPVSGHRFSISHSNNPNEFYFRNLLNYVRSGNLENYAEKLQFIRDQCPGKNKRLIKRNLTHGTCLVAFKCE